MESGILQIQELYKTIHVQVENQEKTLIHLIKSEKLEIPLQKIDEIYKSLNHINVQFDMMIQEARDIQAQKISLINEQQNDIDLDDFYDRNAQSRSRKSITIEVGKKDQKKQIEISETYMKIFKKIGIKKRDLKDPAVYNIIMDAIDKFQLQEGANEEQIKEIVSQKLSQQPYPQVEVVESNPDNIQQLYAQQLENGKRSMSLQMNVTDPLGPKEMILIEVPIEYKEVFKKAGIKKKDLRDPKVTQILLESFEKFKLIQEQEGIQ